MKHTSIILCHYSAIDDFGETSAGKNPPSRSVLMMNCVDSIIKNTNVPAELIVMDNGGKDDDSQYLLDKARDGKLTHVRFPQNMHFAFAWNRGARLATGEYLCFICNDIEVQPNWLSECIRILEEHPDEILIATSFITYDKRRMNTVLENGDRQNPRAGSNCLVIRREDFYKIGEWEHHRIGGTLWYNKIRAMKLRTIAPPKDLACDRGWRHGVNFSIPIKVRKTLLDNSEVDFASKQQ